MSKNNNIIKDFDTYLANKNLSSSTRRMYRSDFNLFVVWFCNKFSIEKYSISSEYLEYFFSNDLMKNYLKDLSDKSTPMKTLKRKIASLTHIQSFIFKDSKIPQSISTQELMPKNVQLSTHDFLTYLKTENASHKTIQNYKTDIQQFISWKKDKDIIDSNNLLISYLAYLNSKFSPASAKRKYYSVKKYMTYSEQANTTKANNTYQSISNTIPSASYHPRLAYAFVGLVGILFASTLSFTKPNQVNTIDNQPITSNSVPLPKVVQVSKLDPNSIAFAKDRGVNIILGTPDNQKTSDTDIYAVALETKDLNDVMQNTSSIKENFAEALNGRAVIPSGNADIVISNSNINKDTIMLVTPTIDTNGAQLFIKEVNNGYAIVSIGKATSYDIPFNWLINSDVLYRSIL